MRRNSTTSPSKTPRNSLVTVPTYCTHILGCLRNTGFGAKPSSKPLTKTSSAAPIAWRFGALQFRVCQTAMACLPRRIGAFETILYATNPFSVSLEQTTTQCYNCFQVLATSKSVRRFSCCQTIGYCSPRCLNISRQYYHSAICGRDFSELVTRGQQSYGGKSEGSQYGNTGKTELSDLTGWNDKPSKGYPKTNYRFPDQSPLVLARALAICLQAGGHPLEHPNIAQLTEGSESVRTVWSLNGMVIGPLKVLEILGVNIFSDERYETWVMRTLW